MELPVTRICHDKALRSNKLPCYSANLTNLLVMPIDDPSLIGVADKPGSDSMDGIENSQDSGKSNSDANGTRESSAASLHHDESHCSELWPERYGWEATKRFDNHIDCGQTRSGWEWNHVWRHDSSWEPSEAQLAEHRNCLLVDSIVTS